MGAVLELVGVGALGKGACQEAGAQCHAVLIPAISWALICKHQQIPGF